MADYLTLAQLEVVWRSQDTYKGMVEAPRTVSPSCEEQRPRTADPEIAYGTSGAHNAWSRPRDYRSHDGIERMGNPSRTSDDLYNDIEEYFAK